MHFGELRPKIMQAAIYSDGLKLIIENLEHNKQLVLPIRYLSFVKMLDGRHTIQEILKATYNARNSLSFRALFETLNSLNHHGLLTGLDLPFVAFEKEETFYDLDTTPGFRAFFKKLLFKRATWGRPNPLLFFLLVMVLIIGAIALPGGLSDGISVQDLFRLNGSYLWALPIIFCGVSVILTLQTLMKCLLMLFATGHLYRVHLKCKWFAIYIDLADNHIFQQSSRLIATFYMIVSPVIYFFVTAVLNLLIKNQHVANDMKVLAVALMFIDLHPYHRSNLTDLCAFFFSENQLRHFIPYLKRQSLLSTFKRHGPVTNELHFVFYSTVALSWVIACMIFLFHLLGANLKPFILGLRGPTFLEMFSASALLFSTLSLFLYVTFDLTKTIFFNLIFPLLSPLSHLHRLINSKTKTSFTHAQLTELLKNVAVFNEIGAAAREFLVTKSIPRSFRKGTPLVIQGGVGRELFVLLKGTVSVSKRETSGYDRKVTTLSPYSVFGEIAVISDVLRTANITANEDVEVLIIDKTVFNDMMKNETFQTDRNAILDKFALGQYFSSSPFFSRLPVEVAHLFTQRGAVESYAPDHEITAEGSVGKSFYLLLKGRVEVLKAGKKVAELHDGEFFGEIALLADLPRTATVRTSLPTTVLRIDQATFWDILTSNIQLAMSLERVAESRLETQPC